MFPLFGEIFKMEVCVDSVQSALNAERGGECLIFSVCLNLPVARGANETKVQKETSLCCMLCLNAFPVNECYIAISLL